MMDLNSPVFRRQQLVTQYGTKNASDVLHQIRWLEHELDMVRGQIADLEWLYANWEIVRPV